MQCLGLVDAHDDAALAMTTVLSANSLSGMRYGWIGIPL
jgi:hypothetical protein